MDQSKAKQEQAAKTPLLGGGKSPDSRKSKVSPRKGKTRGVSALPVK